MHGRPRLPPGQSPDHAKDQSKAKKLNSLLEHVLRNHHERCYTEEALKQSSQLLELNPEFYTAWNYRKLAFRHRMDSEPDEAARKSICENELRMVSERSISLEFSVMQAGSPSNYLNETTEARTLESRGQVEVALRANVKSYGAWRHRKWVIEFGHSSLEHEFFLLQKLLKIDSRNFHAWAHRRFCATANKVTPDEELQYATEKINENFSNYSAWHYRSTLLSQLVNAGGSKEKIIKDEYELVNQAYFTEPDDQSTWFYNTWLLGETKIDSGARLIGTWPLDGSTVRVDLDKESSTICFSSRNPVDADDTFYAEGLPVILSFSDFITDVVVKVSFEPELGHLSDVRWRPLSSVCGPSKIWLADFPLLACPEGEYGLSMKISSQSGFCQDTEIKFCLQISAGDESNAKRKSHWEMERVHWFSAKRMAHEEKEERRCRLVKGNSEPGSVGSLLSAEFQKKTVITAVGKADWRQRLLEEQIQNLRELLELEPNSKWAKLTLSKVLLEQGARTHNHGQYMDEVLDILKELKQLDPDHVAYYESLLSSVFIAKLLQSSIGLKQLWWEPRKVDNEHVGTFGWLRWSGLSLSRFDSAEKLLWVQRLDLSYNQLRSVDGLEALQLLVALDVSHNLLPSVASLASLRLNPELRYLDISHNEIGSHPVDSSRYSFPSTLTNQNLSFTKERQLHQEVFSEDQWEVQAVFEGLELCDLSIFGNVASKNKLFVQVLVKSIPSLEVLDERKVQGGHDIPIKDLEDLLLSYSC